MNTVKGYVFSEINFDESQLQKMTFVKNLEEQSLNFDSGFEIFRTTSPDYNLVHCEILRRTSTYILDFDSTLKSAVKKEVFIYNRASFELDFEHKMAITYGSQTSNVDVRIFFRRHVPFIKIIPINIDISTLYDSLKNAVSAISLKSLTIKKFVYKNGVVGRFAGEIVENRVGEELLAEYSNDIVKATFEIDTEDTKFSIQIFPNGSLRILANDDDHGYALNIVKFLFIDKYA